MGLKEGPTGPGWGGGHQSQTHKKNKNRFDFLHNRSSRVPLLTALCFFVPPEARYYSPAAMAQYTLLLNYISLPV